MGASLLALAKSIYYLIRNLFPSFGYGKLKCVFAVIWPYTWYMKLRVRHFWYCVSEYQTPLRGSFETLQGYWPHFGRFCELARRF